MPSDAQYVGVSRSSISKHWKENRPWYKFFSDPNISVTSFTKYLEKQYNLKLTKFFSSEGAIRIDDIRGLYENMSFYSDLNYGRFPTFNLNFSFNGENISSGEFEVKLFKDKHVNIISTLNFRERSVEEDGVKKLWTGKYPYTLDFISPRLQGRNIQPSIMILMSSSEDYEKIKESQTQR